MLELMLTKANNPRSLVLGRLIKYGELCYDLLTF